MSDKEKPVFIFDGNDITRAIIELLALVRADGSVNMVSDPKGVRRVAKRLAHDYEPYIDAYQWINQNLTSEGDTALYMQALTAMGEARSAGDIE